MKYTIVISICIALLFNPVLAMVVPSNSPDCQKVEPYAGGGWEDGLVAAGVVVIVIGAALTFSGLAMLTDDRSNNDLFGYLLLTPVVVCVIITDW